MRCQFTSPAWAAATLLIFLLGDGGTAEAKKPCPFWGHLYPKPDNLAGQPGMVSVAQALDGLFPQYIDNAADSGASNFSYAVEVFSTRDGGDDRPLWSHYWTAPRLPEQDAAGVGVKKVGPETVFRIGSVTKIFTVLAFLAEVGDRVWNDPVTKYIPELAAIAASRKDVERESTWSVDWDDITIGSLAGQTAGLIRDYSLLSELTWQTAIRPDLLVYFGFPPLNLSEVPPCGSYPTCSRQQLFTGFARQPPSFPPFATPVYSDVGFVLLAWALENITGKKYADIIRDSIAKPLNLTGTYTTPPPESVGVIPGERHSSGWTLDMNNEVGTGGMWSSTRDLAKLGRAIMGSKLMKPSMTRRWLRPVTFSSDPRASVGEPWGVRQVPLTQQNSSYQYVTSFNKAGQVGRYGTVLALIPEFDLGFAVMAAGDVPAGFNMYVAEALSGVYFPTMVSVSRSAANATFGGRYRSSTLNSTLFISAADPSDTHPGLKVREWISNGTDMLPVALSAATYVSASALPGAQISIRLYPTGLEDKANAKTGKQRAVAFKAIFEDLNQAEASGPYTSDCATWVAQSGAMWASQPLDQFIFELDEKGRARAVRNAALRATLEWVGYGDGAAVGGGGKGNGTASSPLSSSLPASSTVASASTSGGNTPSTSLAPTSSAVGDDQ